MKVKELFADDDAVSPVIGVILMVAITVILAAVIATFVLGLGDQVSNTAPQASFDFNYDGSTSPPTLEVTHSGGDTIEASNLYIRGSNEDGSWDTIGTFQANSEITAGNSVTVDMDASDTVRVVWETAEGSQSATLAKFEGPEAS